MLVETKEGLLLSVKVTPKARQPGITGWENGVLKIKVAAPPDKGEANQAVIDLLAHTLNIPKKNVLLIRGGTSRFKQFCLIGITKENAERYL